jgi:hypothetical protein
MAMPRLQEGQRAVGAILPEQRMRNRLQCTVIRKGHSMTTTAQIAGEDMTKDQIRDIFMAHGFTIKEGQTDLKPYVYDAARALLASKPAVPCSADDTRNLVTLDRRDLWDHVRGAIHAALNDKIPKDCVVSWAWEEATNRTMDIFQTIVDTAPAQSCGDAEQASYSAPFTADVPHCCGNPDTCNDPCDPRASEQADEAVTDERLTSAIELMKRLKRDLMHARRFSADTLANYRRACSSAEGDVEEWLKEHAGTRAKDGK